MFHIKYVLFDTLTQDVTVAVLIIIQFIIKIFLNHFFRVLLLKLITLETVRTKSRMSRDVIGLDQNAVLFQKKREISMLRNIKIEGEGE